MWKRCRPTTCLFSSSPKLWAYLRSALVLILLLVVLLILPAVLVLLLVVLLVLPVVLFLLILVVLVLLLFWLKFMVKFLLNSFAGFPRG